MADMDAGLLRRGFEMELRNERDNCARAVNGAASALREAQQDLADSRVPSLGNLRRAVAEASEAYQRAAAWKALERVAFMLPADETKVD